MDQAARNLAVCRFANHGHLESAEIRRTAPRLGGPRNSSSGFRTRRSWQPWPWRASRLGRSISFGFRTRRIPAPAALSRRLVPLVEGAGTPVPDRYVDATTPRARSEVERARRGTPPSTDLSTRSKDGAPQRLYFPGAQGERPLQAVYNNPSWLDLETFGNIRTDSDGHIAFPVLIPGAKRRDRAQISPMMPVAPPARPAGMGTSRGDSCRDGRPNRRGRNQRRCELRSDRPKQPRMSLRASVGSTEASASLPARVGVVGPKRATRQSVRRIRRRLRQRLRRACRPGR